MDDHPRLSRFPGLPSAASDQATRVLTTLAAVPAWTITGQPAGTIPSGTVLPAAKSTSRGRVVDVVTAGPFAGRVVERHTGRIRVEPTSAYDMGESDL